MRRCWITPFMIKKNHTSAVLSLFNRIEGGEFSASLLDTFVGPERRMKSRFERLKKQEKS